MPKFLRNRALLTDSYKPSHWLQYPPGAAHVYSYFESRGGVFEETVFVLMHYLLREFFEAPITSAEIDEAKEVWAAHFGSDAIFNEAGWRRIVTVHNGYLPLRIRAVPEGLVIPTGNVLVTVENTDPELPWLTNWFETLLSQLWYPCTVATQSREMKKILLKALIQSGTPELVDFKLHDFGFRGVTSVEQAAIGGAAHLVNFKGTDTMPGILLLRRYYNEPMAGFSVPAAEHSTITTWPSEVAAFRNMIQRFGHMPFYAVVSDSYDIIAACRDLWGTQLKQEVEQAPGVLVVRPDSGEPTHIVPRVLTALAEKFGVTRNAKGFYVLNDRVRVIQGDGIEGPASGDTLGPILDAVMAAGFSADNVAFGSGGGLLQKMNRDTSKYAFKASHIRFQDGSERDVFKKPVTDLGKQSKRGRLKLVHADQFWNTVGESHPLPDMLETVYENGKILVFPTLADIRARAAL